MKKLSFFCLISLLFACSNNDILSQLPDNRPDYKQSRTVNPLEVPPDLTQSSVDDRLVVPELSGVNNAQLSAYQNERNGQNQSTTTLESALKNIRRNGDANWIELAAKPDVVFKDAKNFWLNNGLPLTRVDSNIGIMETDWLATKANLPRSGISRLVAKVLSGLKDNGVRDKFRTRIDYDGKTTYVYMTHYGATEEEVTEQGTKVKGNNKGGNAKTSHYAYLASSRNQELEVEMLRRLNLHLQKSGKQIKQAHAGKQSSKAQMQFTTLSDGTPTLVMQSNFNQAWILLGIAIDRAGYEISQQDRKNGTYRFAKITETKTGFIVKQTERSVENYTLGLADQGGRQLAVIRSHNKQPIQQAAARAILQKISQEIRF